MFRDASGDDPVIPAAGIPMCVDSAPGKKTREHAAVAVRGQRRREAVAVTPTSPAAQPRAGHCGRMVVVARRESTTGGVSLGSDTPVALRTGKREQVCDECEEEQSQRQREPWPDEEHRARPAGGGQPPAFVGGWKAGSHPAHPGQSESSSGLRSPAKTSGTGDQCQGLCVGPAGRPDPRSRGR